MSRACYEEPPSAPPSRDDPDSGTASRPPSCPTSDPGSTLRAQWTLLTPGDAQLFLASGPGCGVPTLLPRDALHAPSSAGPHRADFLPSRAALRLLHAFQILSPWRAGPAPPPDLSGAAPQTTRRLGEAVARASKVRTAASRSCGVPARPKRGASRRPAYRSVRTCARCAGWHSQGL